MENRRPHVAVFFGGQAGSYDLSCETGQWLCHYLPRSKYRITPVRITPRGKWQVPLGSLPRQGPVRKILKNLFRTVRAVPPARGLERLLRSPVKVMMTLARGKNGDDGSLHGLGGSLDIPVAGPAQRVCQQTADKYVCGRRLDAVAASPEGRRFRRFEPAEQIADEAQNAFMPPLFVKPVSQESSYGTVEVYGREQLLPAVRAAQKLGDVLVQPRSPGTEIVYTLFDDARGRIHRLPPTAVAPRQTATYYDYLAKRRPGRVDLRTPPADHDQIPDEAEELARDVYEELDCRGPVTMDIMVDEESAELLDVNTIPSFTDHTPLKHQLKAAGIHPSLFFDSFIQRSLNEGTGS